MNAAEPFVTFISADAKLPLVTPQNRSFSIWCDDAEHRGVLLAVRNLQTDFEKVTTVKPELSNIAGKEVRIIIGSFDKSPLIRQLVKTGKLDGKELRGKNEKYIITTLHAPLEGLQGDVLLIAGSDKRGTIYGIYELSKQIGISPWYWWLDVPPVKHQAIYIKEGVYINIVKNIPVSAGLAGGSTDGAAVLKLMNKLFEVNASDEELALATEKFQFP